MRLDHLLSREPIILGSNHGVRPVGGGLVCFLVLACVYCPTVGGGCGCVFGLGIKRLMRTSTLSGSRSTPCERPPVVVVARMPASDCCVVGVGVCGGLFVICIVVASIFVLYCFLCFV